MPRPTGPWQFPPHWNVVREKKPHFTVVPTLLEFESLPDKLRLIWTSRRHRRGRKVQVPKQQREPTKFRWWGFKNSISYWTEILFLFGFCWLIAAQICKLVLCTHERFETCSGAAQLVTVQIFLFIGNGIFLVAAYFTYLEVINQKSGPTAKDIQVQNISWDQPIKKMHKMIGWRPKELSFWAAIVLIVGVLLFILHLIFEQIEFFKHNHVANSVGVWMPAIIAATCFAATQYLHLVELGHSWFPWKPQSLVFWLLVMRLVASFLYLAASICSLWLNDTVRLWGSKVTFLMGSVVFWFSFYAGLLEVLN